MHSTSSSEEPATTGTLPNSTTATSSNTNTTTTVKVLYCYSKYEVMDGVTFEDDVGQVDCALSIDDINKKAEEFFGETLNDQDDDNDDDNHHTDSLLEWYNASTQEWKPLTRMDETTTLLHFAQQDKMLPVRLPFLFDESDHPAMADDPMTDPLGNGMNGHDHAFQMYTLDEAVQLLQQLRVEQGYETVPTQTSPSLTANIDTFHLQLNGPPLLSSSAAATSDSKDDSVASNDTVVSTITPVAVSTRDWVLHQATLFKSRGGDSKLAHTLLMNIGALDRICSGLHDPSSETSSDNDDDDTLSFPPPPTWHEEQRHHDAYHRSHSHDRHGHCIIKEDDRD